MIKNLPTKKRLRKISGWMFLFIPAIVGVIATAGIKAFFGVLFVLFCASVIVAWILFSAYLICGD